MNISYNNFLRTTQPEHEKEVKNVLQKLYDKKFIFKGYYEAYYCVGCEQYLTQSDLVEGKCPLHQKEPEIKKEEAYLFKLSAFQPKLLDLIKQGKYCILPIKRRNEVISFIEQGLQDISISRKKSEVYWGIGLPFDKDHTTFVWVDAFWNYITGLDDKKNFKKFWPPDVQLMANDILRVHATIWPALLLALGIALPKKLFVHGYFTINGQKISKSLGNVISPVYLAGEYGVDALRYFFVRGIPFGSDGDFSEDALKERYNSELADNLGNLVSRVVGLIEKKLGGKICRAKIDEILSKKLKLDEIKKKMENLEIDRALALIFEFVNACNLYVQGKKAWLLQGKELEQVLYTLADSLRIISILLYSFIPASAEKIAFVLGVDLTKARLEDCRFGLLEDCKVKNAGVLFPKRD